MQKPSGRMVSSRQAKTKKLGGLGPDPKFVGLGCLADLFHRDRQVMQVSKQAKMLRCRLNRHLINCPATRHPIIHFHLYCFNYLFFNANASNI